MVYLQEGLQLCSKVLKGAPGVPVLQLGYWVAGKCPVDWALEAGVQQVQQRGVEGMQAPFEGQAQMDMVAVMLLVDCMKSLHEGICRQLRADLDCRRSVFVKLAERYEYTAFCAGRASLKCRGAHPSLFCSVV